MKYRFKATPQFKVDATQFLGVDDKGTFQFQNAGAWFKRLTKDPASGYRTGGKKVFYCASRVFKGSWIVHRDKHILVFTNKQFHKVYEPVPE